MFLQLFVLVLVTHQLQSSPRLNAKHPGAKISLEELEAENTRGECVLPLPSYICPQFKDELDETSDEEPQADPESAEKTFWPFTDHEGSGEEGSGSETSGEDPASVFLPAAEPRRGHQGRGEDEEEANHLPPLLLSQQESHHIAIN